MYDSIPPWLPWVQIAFAIPACLIYALLFVALVSIPLPNACKVFLYTHTIALFGLAFGHLLIADWTKRNNRGIGLEELHYFPLILAHEGFYLVSTASLFYLTCERLLLCFRPTFYEYHKLRLLPCLIVAVSLESLHVAPMLIMLQYACTRDLSQLFSILIEIITVTLLLICYRQSKVFYTSHFSKVTLNARYQVKEVIELTRVLIPVCIVSLSMQLLIEALAKWVFTDPTTISLASLVLCAVATAMAYIEPVLLMLRHRSMSRKISEWINPGKIRPTVVRVDTSTEDATQSYFASLQRDWA